MNIFTLILSVLIAALILRGVIRGSRIPLHESGRKLLIPILYISSSLFELFDPSLVLTSGRVIFALAAGVILALPLIIVTRFERRSDGRMYYVRSTWLYTLVVVIFVVRYLDYFFALGIDLKTLGFLNNLIALSYIAIWRIGSFVKFRQVRSFSLQRWNNAA